MIRWLLMAAQLLVAPPVTKGYAVQYRKDVVVSVTFTDVRPTKVCSYMYAIEDSDMETPEATHCWVPTSDIGSIDVWRNMRLEDGNWKVVVTYRNRPTDTLFLVARLNS